MKTKRLLITAIAVMLILAIGVIGAVAWLLDQKTTTNTFTVGNVHLESLVETTATDDDADGSYAFHLIPGSTYDMTPVVTVKATSEDAYVRVIVTFEDAEDLVEVLGTDIDADGTNDVFLPHNYVGGWKDSVWVPVSTDAADYAPNAENQIVVEFRYYKVVEKNSAENTTLPAVFSTFTVPGTVTNEGLAQIAELEIGVVAHAIQADNLATADEAWAAFDAQVNP